jgi:hypothetical protein
MERTQLAPDGKTPHATLALALAEALSPKLQGNLDATPRVIALAQAMAQRGLQKLHCKKVLTIPTPPHPIPSHPIPSYCRSYCCSHCY